MARCVNRVCLDFPNDIQDYPSVSGELPKSRHATDRIPELSIRNLESSVLSIVLPREDHGRLSVSVIRALYGSAAQRTWLSGLTLAYKKG